MSDLIKRDKAIETAVSAAVDWHRYANPYYSLAACIGDAMSKIPSAPSWIPVAERLPEVGEWVIVCDITGDIDMNIRNDSGEFFKEWGSKQEIVAWMPLPEPYKEG